MAQQIKLLSASSLSELESAINTYIEKQSEDSRVIVELAGGVTCAADMPEEGMSLWVAAVRVSAPHKRKFSEESRGSE